MQLTINEPAAMAKAVEMTLGELTPRADQAVVLGLIGDLGSGKTTFVQHLARALGVTEPVTSPTFVIEKVYPLSSQSWKRLIHFDAYRLDSPEELAKLRFAEQLADPGNLIVVEWAERVALLLPPDYRRLNFKFIDGETRELSW